MPQAVSTESDNSSLDDGWSIGRCDDLPGFFQSREDSSTNHYVVTNLFPSGDCELTALRFRDGDRLRTGGGAVRKKSEKKEMDFLTLQKSQNRSKKQVRHRCMCIRADRLLTLTFKENVKSIEDAWKRLEYFHKLMRFRYKDRYQFVSVPEYQKRGAVHFHLAISGFYSVRVVRHLWRKAAGSFGGNIDITDPKKFDKKSWNPRRIGQYISKYISKTDSVAFNKKRYGASKNQPQPIKHTGWLSPGVADPLYLLRELFAQYVGRAVKDEYELDGRFKVYFLST